MSVTGFTATGGGGEEGGGRPAGRAITATVVGHWKLPTTAAVMYCWPLRGLICSHRMSGPWLSTAGHPLIQSLDSSTCPPPAQPLSTPLAWLTSPLSVRLAALEG